MIIRRLFRNRNRRGVVEHDQARQQILALFYQTGGKGLRWRKLCAVLDRAAPLSAEDWKRIARTKLDHVTHRGGLMSKQLVWIAGAVAISERLR